jgi:hypothetical protein
MSPVTLVGVIEKNREHHLSIEVILVCRPNHSDTTDVFMRRLVFGMSPGLTNSDIALPLSTLDMTG